MRAARVEFLGRGRNVLEEGVVALCGMDTNEAYAVVANQPCVSVFFMPSSALCQRLPLGVTKPKKIARNYCGRCRGSRLFVADGPAFFQHCERDRCKILQVSFTTCPEPVRRSRNNLPQVRAPGPEHVDQDSVLQQPAQAAAAATAPPTRPTGR